jgi:hypothetical protein
MAKSRFSTKTKKVKKAKKTRGSGGGKKSNAWRAYTSGGKYTPSNAPLPD